MSVNVLHVASQSAAEQLLYLQAEVHHNIIESHMQLELMTCLWKNQGFLLPEDSQLFCVSQAKFVLQLHTQNYPIYVA